MRYLGLVWSETTLPHVKDVCQIEMIARSAKKIFRKQLAEIVLHNSDEQAKKKRLGLFGVPHFEASMN